MRTGAGRIFCEELISRLGEGRSTLLRTLMGMITPSAGEVLINGRSVEGYPAHAIAELGAAFVPQTRRVFGRLTVYENIVMGRSASAGRSKAAWGVERIFEIFPRLRDIQDYIADEVDSDQRQFLTIARSLFTGPCLLMLDDPADGLSPNAIGELSRALVRLRDDGVAVLFTERESSLMEGVEPAVFFMDAGRLVDVDGRFCALASA